MATLNRPKLGEVRNLANRNNLVDMVKPANLESKNRILLRKKINDENQDVARYANGKNALKDAQDDLVKKVSQLSTSTSSRSRIPVLGMRQQNKQASSEAKLEEASKSNAIQPLHPVITHSMKIENIDTDRNIFLLGEYADDIYKYLFQLEKTHHLKARFMRDQNQAFTENTRAVLVNWVCSVHSKYINCNNETLYLTVFIIDQYLSKKFITKDRLQLLGITAYFVASKFEEIYYPDVKEIVSFCDNLYNKKDVLKMELEILKVLDFGLGAPLVIHFLRRGSKAARSSSSMHMMSKYLCELSLLDYEISSWSPSLIAAVALYLTLRMFETSQLSGEGDSKSIDKIWNNTIEYYTNYTHAAVLKFSPYMCRAIVKSEASKFQNVRKKYSEARYMKISCSPMLCSTFIRQFASKLDSPRNIALKK